MGCGNTRAQVNAPTPKDPSCSNIKTDPKPQSNSECAKDIKSNGTSKILEVKTCAKDIESITQQADMTILQFSNLSMTDLVSNGMFLINAVIGLIEANIGKNQLMKAVLRRMQALEPAFQELQTKNNKLTKEPIINLIHIVNRIKGFCEKTMAIDKSLWDKFKDAITAKAQLSELSHLNELLTKAQADLQIPMQLETSKKIDKIFTYLKDINEKGSEVFSKNEKNGNVLPMAQRCLKNEEAFVFWFECMPTKYQVPIKKFESIFKDYIEIYKDVKLKPESLGKIIDLLRGSNQVYDDKELINAKQVNAFFESIPLDVQWDNETTFKKNVEEVNKQREVQVKQIIEHQEKKLEEKVKKNEALASDEEMKMIKNGQYFRFLAKNASIGKGKRKTEINVRNIFIKIDDGDVQIYGNSKKEGEFVLNGSIQTDGTLSLEMRIANGKTFTAEGEMEVKETVLLIKLTTDIGKIIIHLDVEYWFGYYESEGEPSNMECFLKIIGNDVIGYSKDEVGDAVWKGKIKGETFNAKKYYITQHEVKYEGKIKRVGTQREIRGKWVIDEDSQDNFYLSHNEGGDYDKREDNEEGNDDSDHELENCPNGHKLVWNKERGEYPENFCCDNCGDERMVEVGRWNCAKDQYDICGTCKKIPEKETKTCPKGHQLEWNNKQGDYPQPSYLCDICNRDETTSKGRWHCKICTYDLCPKCRKP